MSDLQERYDELDEIISRLGLLEDDIKIYEDIKEEIAVLKWEAQKELDEIEPQLQKEQDDEQRALENEYWKSQL